MKGRLSNRPLASRLRRISSLVRTVTQSPAWSTLLLPNVPATLGTCGNRDNALFCATATNLVVEFALLPERRLVRVSVSSNKHAGCASAPVLGIRADRV